MPIPIIGWAVGAAAVAVAGAVYKMWNNDEDSSNSNENTKYEYDSTIIIGPQQSGKTHLANWLAHHKLLVEYIPTDYKMNINNFMDYSGHYEDAHYWENDIRDNKNIFYLFDLKKYIEKYSISNEEYNNVVVNQVSFLTEYLTKKDSFKSKKIIIIGTHLDKIDNNKAQQIVSELKSKISLGNAKILYGSLDNEANASKVEEKIINALKEF